MKLFYRFFGLLMIAGIILQPGSTRAGSLRDAVDVFLTPVQNKH